MLSSARQGQFDVGEDPAKKPSLFGRQKTKKLSARQQHLVDVLLPELKLNPDQDEPDTKGWLSQRPLWMEIGFGGGEHLANLAEKHPEVNFIGCEPFLNGLAKLLVAISEKNLTNIRIYNHDARHILAWLPPASLDQLYLLYPDPWPKKRHRKRRFTTMDNLALIARTLKPGAGFLIASDIPDYIRTTLIALMNTPDLAWQPQSANDWKIPPEGWPGTRYEKKALREGRTPVYLKLKKS